MAEIKANSSRWINERRLVKGKFYWQEGFGAFSYSRSQLDDVIRYVNDQEIRHKTSTFKDEYIGLLERFEVEFDERYLFKQSGE